jgi:hypothetical protein
MIVVTNNEYGWDCVVQVCASMEDAVYFLNTDFHQYDPNEYKTESEFEDICFVFTETSLYTKPE